MIDRSTVRPFPYQRGFAAIGLVRPKTGFNVASVLRAAHCYGASMLAIAGDRTGGDEIRHAANTFKTERHMPVMRGDDIREMVPFGAAPIAVDLLEDAEPLPSFQHPASAFYIFGPEDGTLGRAITDWCPFKVVVPTIGCMNLAATVNVVLYDRVAKAMRAARKQRQEGAA